MPAFPIWGTVSASWHDVSRNQIAAIRACWPMQVALLLMMILEVMSVAPIMKAARAGQATVRITRASTQSPEQMLIGMCVVMLPCMIATVLSFGGWARFLAAGESRWGFSGRGFWPALIAQIKIFVLLIVAWGLVTTGYAAILGHFGRQGPIMIGATVILCVLLFAGLVVVLRLSLLLPQAAITGRSDLLGLIGALLYKLLPIMRVPEIVIGAVIGVGLILAFFAASCAFYAFFYGLYARAYLALNPAAAGPGNEAEIFS